MKIIILILLGYSLSSNASSFLERNSQTGILDQEYSTTKDSNRYSLLFHINGNVMKAMEYMNFEFIYSRKMEYCWLDFFVAKSSGAASTYTTQNETTTNGLLSGGIGVSYRFKFLKNLLNSNRLFETTGASLAYYQFTENVNVFTYSGAGIKVDYGIHYRSSSKFHYGIKFSYNLGSVIREALSPTESRNQRSLTLSWTSLALEFAYYF